MRKENGVLVLENEEDKDLLFDYFDNYIDYMNYEGEDENTFDENKFKELYAMAIKSKNEFQGYVDSFYLVEKIFDYFTHREEFNVTLFPKALKCLEALDLVKVDYKKEPKYKLTKNTYNLLSMIKLNWVAKDEDGKVYVYTNKPEKCLECWVVDAEGNAWYYLEHFKNVDFSFLSWEDEEPTRISDILSDYEIIEEE